MSVCFSPLRYPGGKQILTHVLAHLIRLNDVQDGIYVEPYAGGGGAALSLMFSEHVKRIVINDLDPSVFAMWWSILNRTDEFLKLLRDTPISMRSWQKQREVYRHPGRSGRVRRGFAAFYLNRANRSGIISGGPVGGLEQAGAWGIDARFNKVDLQRKIERITAYKDRIDLFNLDAVDLLRIVIEPLSIKERVFVYLDPPYYSNGERLYMSYHDHEEHEALRDYLTTAEYPWILTYDNGSEVRELYSKFHQVTFNLAYRVAERRMGHEVMIVRPGLAIPAAWARRVPQKYITTTQRPMAMPVDVMYA